MHRSQSQKKLSGGDGSGDQAVPSLRICFAADGRTDDYQELRVEFRDTLMWRQAMGLAPQRLSASHDHDHDHDRTHDSVPESNKHQGGPDSCVQLPGDSNPAGAKRLWARMSRRFETLGSAPSSAPARAKRPPIHRPPPGRRPRGTQAAHRSREDAEVEDNRQLALGILEGRHVPAPDRSYTGSLTHIFQSMYQDEIKAHLDALSCRIRRLLDLPGRRRGWALLHSIIASELRPEDLCGVPRPRAGQKAVLLLVEEQARGGEEETRVRGRRNLEACSAGELDDVLEGVEARGWQDVILVTASDGSMPLRLGGRREVRVLEWGRDMI